VPGSDFVLLVERALGQLLYLSVATHGLFLLGLLGMSWTIWRGLKTGGARRTLTDPTTGVSLLALGTGAGIFAAACTLKLYSVHGERGLRGADFIHGRYNEALAVVVLAFALAELCRGRIPWRRQAWRTVAVVAVILCLGLVVMAEVEHALERQAGDEPSKAPRHEVLPSEVDAIAAPGVYPLVGLVGEMNLRRIALLAGGLFLALTLTLRRSWRAGVALLVLLFGFFAHYNYRHHLLPRMARVESRLDLASEIRRLGPVDAVSYDVAYRERGLVAGLQFLLPEAVFERFDSREAEEPTAEAVIAAANWPQARRLGARFVLPSGRGGALWVLPGELQARLPEVSLEGMNLAARPGLDLQTTGLFGLESFDGVPGRWTNGAATLTVPVDPDDPPREIHLALMAAGREQARLRLLVNGVELWREPLPRRGWSRQLSLQGVPVGDELRVEILSDTFSPAETRPGSRDRRLLGVVVTELRLE
jgi:hypothetical protein